MIIIKSIVAFIDDVLGLTVPADTVSTRDVVGDLDKLLASLGAQQ